MTADRTLGGEPPRPPIWDTMFVIEQKDMMAAFDTLNSIISM
ncbi:MAG: hypothetical protein WDA16_15005 [Candidatus Thermoplasmatota archaeon]